MGNRGPSPTPSNILKQRGSWRGDRNKKEPRPAAPLDPRCPHGIGQDPVSKKVWKYLIPILVDAKLAFTIDRNALIRYCTHWSRWLAAKKFLDENGLDYEITDAQGNNVTRIYPHEGVEAKQSGILASLEAKFGMTPSDRTRIADVFSGTESVDDDKRRFFTG